MTDLSELFEQEFPIDSNLLYLNHAAVAPWPTRTGDAVRRFAAECVDMGAHDYPSWLDQEHTLRGQLARQVNALSSEDIALVKNTSEGLSMIAHGFPWRAGDNVVIAAGEFPSNRIVWESLSRYGVELRQVPLARCEDPESALLAAADDRTRLLSVSSVHYVTGLRLDLARLGRQCRGRGIAFCVDAIQGLGVVPHDVQEMGIDFLASDAHKWMLGPEGIAVFYCSPQWRERLTLHEYGWHMTDHPEDFDRLEWSAAASARRFECGSPNMLGIHAFAASLELLEEVGLAEIEHRVLGHARLLMEGISANPRLELLTRNEPGRYAGIVSFRHRTIPSATLFQHLQEQRVVCAQRGGGIRLSPHAYHRTEVLEQVLDLIAL